MLGGPRSKSSQIRGSKVLNHRLRNGCRLDLEKNSEYKCAPFDKTKIKIEYEIILSTKIKIPRLSLKVESPIFSRSARSTLEAADTFIKF